MVKRATDSGISEADSNKLYHCVRFVYKGQIFSYIKYRDYGIIRTSSRHIISIMERKPIGRDKRSFDLMLDSE